MQEEVAASFRASRLPVREALRMLEAEGLVVLKANSGAWVSKMDLVNAESHGGRLHVPGRNPGYDPALPARVRL
ncbi:GntR family transcriptional regulator [Streptomyces chartreusis]|uniref:GntR family transcriptional regulator n=1 Tax=Streptomyces chartreusis TaxID=1969 RepID=UPI00371C2B08